MHRVLNPASTQHPSTVLRLGAALFVALALSATIGNETVAAQGGVPLAWDPNPEPSVSGYIVHVGTSPRTYSHSYNVGNTTVFTYSAGKVGKRYYFAVVAYTAAGETSPLSAEVSGLFSAYIGPTVTDSTLSAPSTLSSASDASSLSPQSASSTTTLTPKKSTSTSASTTMTPPPDSAPTSPPPPGIVIRPPTLNGNHVLLEWTPVGTTPIIEYLLEVGTAPGASDLTNSSVGLATSQAATVEGGVFHARVRGRVSTTDSVVSNEVVFSTLMPTCAGPPATPPQPVQTGFTSSGQLTLSWGAAAGATSYLVQIGTTPGGSDLLHQNVGPNQGMTSTVSAGFTGYARVFGVNACGSSAASPQLVID
jgi:hypothetical protein